MTKPESTVRFELVTLGGAEIVGQYYSHESATYRALFQTGVPRDFLQGVITADAKVSLYEGGNIGPVLKFAHGYRGHFALDPADEKVVLVMNPDRADIRGLKMVNSSLPQFVETLQLLTERFPYEYWNEDDQEVEYAFDDLVYLIESVDPAARTLRINGREPFWSSFAWDVEMGTYSQEAITGIEWTPST